MKHYDTIIIGAGLSGCTLGYLLKKQNKSVLIIEKQDIKKKNKLCGGLITKKSYDLLNEIYNSENIKKLSIMEHNKVEINDGNIKIDVNEINTYSLYRKELDDFVLNNYIKQGGEILDNTIYNNFDLDKNEIIINKQQYFFNNIVGADGIFSQLRVDITKRRQRSNYALEVLNSTMKSSSLSIQFFDNFKGYGWIIPNGKYDLVGLGNVNGVSKIDNVFNKYLYGLNIKDIKKKGAFLPSGNDILLSHKNTVFFIGDSAGLISPITGEGIYYALYSAYALSKNMNLNYKKSMSKVIKNIKNDLFYLKFVYNCRIRKYLFGKYNKNIIITKLINRFVKHIL